MKTSALDIMRKIDLLAADLPETSTELAIDSMSHSDLKVHAKLLSRRIAAARTQLAAATKAKP